MNAAKMTLVSTVVAAALGLALGLIGAPADSYACHRFTDHGSQTCGGGGPIQFTAELTVGAFVFDDGTLSFGPVDVTTNSKENELRSMTDLVMVRPDDAGDLDETWDQVFDTCTALLDPGSVDEFRVDENHWRISKPGGVRVIFIDMLLPGLEDIDPPLVEVTVQLVGNEFDFVDSFLPEAIGQSRTYDLDEYIIWGETLNGTHPRRGCQPPGGGGADINELMPSGSTLVIRAVAAP